MGVRWFFLIKLKNGSISFFKLTVSVFLSNVSKLSLDKGPPPNILKTNKHRTLLYNPFFGLPSVSKRNFPGIPVKHYMP